MQQPLSNMLVLGGLVLIFLGFWLLIVHVKVFYALSVFSHFPMSLAWLLPHGSEFSARSWLSTICSLSTRSHGSRASPAYRIHRVSRKISGICATDCRHIAEDAKGIAVQYQRPLSPDYSVMSPRLKDSSCQRNAVCIGLVVVGPKRTKPVAEILAVHRSMPSRVDEILIGWRWI